MTAAIDPALQLRRRFMQSIHRQVIDTCYAVHAWDADTVADCLLACGGSRRRMGQHLQAWLALPVQSRDLRAQGIPCRPAAADCAVAPQHLLDFIRTRERQR